MPDSAHFALHRPELLGALHRGEARIADIMAGTARRFPAGRIIVDAGAEHSMVYRVKSGWVGRVRPLEDGRSQFILLFLPGDLFAVKSMMVTRHPDAIQTLAASTLEQVDHRVLRDKFRADSDVALRCMWQVMEEERRLHNWVVGLGQGSADERMAMLMIDLHGRLALSGTIAAEDSSFAFPMTQVQTGDHLGISAVHVNRVLKAFREEGLLTIKSGRVTILDRNALAKRARPLLDIY